MSWRTMLGIQVLSAEPAQPAQPRFGKGSAGCEGSAPAIGTTGAGVGAAAPERDPSRWLRFKALCLARGADPAELAEHFPTIADREDIACSADESLQVLVGHVVALVLAERPVRAADALWRAIDAADDTSGRVQCGVCRHFARFEGRPHDGACRAGAGRSAVRWDVSWIACEVHERDDAAAAPLERAA